jgi:HD-GYP domain-containing protein (c-di-GMP phosphodiesterase class II)
VVVLWLSRGANPVTSLRGFGLGVFTAIHLTLALVGVAVALIVVTSNWVGLLVFALPLLTARQILQNSARLQHDYPNTVRVLVRSIEAKDEYTRGHSERVADYAVQFCSHLGLSDAQTERIQFAAMLHDLGKMCVRAEVLNKPARLDEAEYAEMQQHSAAALPIVAKIPRTDDLLPVIRHHHERIDGRGYPDGIEGDGIPYASRLLAVCDTYDAMTSSRPYRPALSQAEAVHELTTVAGTQLDGSLALAFVEMLSGEPKADRQ